MNSETRNEVPSRRRLQFRLLSLFMLMTLTCLIMTWLVWPKAIEVVSLVMATTSSVSETGVAVPQPEFVDYQTKLMAAFTAEDVLKDAVDVAGNGKLAMLRGRSEPVDWVRRRMEVTLTPQSVISVKMTVPEQFEQDAMELVDYIVLRAITQFATNRDPIPRSQLAELVQQQQSLEQSMNATSRQLDRAKKVRGADSTEAAALEADFTSQRDAWKRLSKDINASELVDAFIDQVRLIQLATVQGKPHKTLVF